MTKTRGLTAIDRTGHRYNRLEVLSRAPNIETPNGPVTQWLCQCDCGNRVVVRGPGLAKAARGKGGTQSCGCLNRENDHSRTHGKHNTRVYRIWQMMVQRCTNDKVPHWESYGGRGITVCDAWMTFETFFADMGEPGPLLTLERLNNDLGYSPENCVWASRQQQGNNRRSNVILSFGGRKMTIADWAREIGISKSALNNRLADNWSVERALTEPLAKRSPRKPKGQPHP